MLRRILLIFIAAAVLVCAVVLSCHYRRQAAADEMLVNMKTVLKDYPELPVSFVSNFCCMKTDGIQYLWMEMGGRRVTGRRIPDGQTEYCFAGETYLETDGILTVSERDMEDITPVFKQTVMSYMQDPQITYTYHKPFGRDLPMWIYPTDEAYLLIQREGYHGYTENMVYENRDTEAVRWCFLESGENVLLYLNAADARFKNINYVRGWGYIPQAVIDFLLKKNGMTDDALYEMVCSQIMEIAEQYSNEVEILENLTSEQRTFYVLSTYDREVQNGGLCQFFVNSSRYLAPYVEEALAEIGAGEHCKLFAKFITENEIDVWHLESYQIESIRQYAVQFARHDFGSFDDTYYKLPPLYDDLVYWTRDHIDAF